MLALAFLSLLLELEKEGREKEAERGRRKEIKNNIQEKVYDYKRESEI